MYKLVCGVGLYEKGVHPYRVGQKFTKEYSLWKGMLRRCYSERFQKECPTYVGCSVSEEFSNFQKFAEWCNTQVGFGGKGWQLDKDIIYKDNKQYNRDSCALVPKKVNLLLTASNNTRGEWPIGVYFDKKAGKFKVQCCFGESPKTLGRYATPEEAFSVYKIAKEAHVKVVAEQYKDSIDPRVYQALLEWEVHIND